MKVTAPVTDYIRASTMNTQGDLVVRGALVPERLIAGALDTYLKAQGAGNIPIYEALALRDTGVQIGTALRSTSGDQVISGIGFRPSIIIFFDNGYDDGTKARSWGAGNLVNNMCTAIDHAQNAYSSVTECIFHRVSAGDHMEAIVTALSGDGFTLTWTRVGVTSQCFFIYICLP